MQEKLPLIRLASGLVLFVFLTMHLLNHALGNISLDALEWGRGIFLAVWRNPVGTALLYGALVIHALLVMYALFRKRTLRMPVAEAVQIVMGFTIPVLVASHVLANRGAHEVFGVNDTYAYVILSLWVFVPWQGVLQTVALLAAWTHGVLGLYFWFRLKPWFPKFQAWLFAAALLLPAVSLSGFAGAGKEAALLAKNDVWLQRKMAAMNLPGQEGIDWVYENATRMGMTSLALVLMVLLGRFGREQWEKRRGRFTVSYPSGQRVTVEKGVSILEASRIGNIPHASVCGGRGRCSTCRVRVLMAQADLPEPSEEETKVLARVGAPDGVRLACQLRPAADLSVIPLLLPGAQPKEGYRRPQYLQGAEREIAILFADLRSFTKFSESKLPYDVVFALNQYFRGMGSAVEEAGGRLDKFIGDGVMALFGIQNGREAGCRDALQAAAAMSRALADLNEQLRNDLQEPLRMGIGIHVGPAIVGEMGYREATSITAIGDSVNTASRLESLTKEYGVQLIVSEEVASASGDDLSTFPREEVAIRGREQPLAVRVIADAGALPDRPPGTATEAGAA